MILKLKASQPAGLPSHWCDEPNKPLEQQLGPVLAGIIVAVASQRRFRERRLAEERRRWEAAEIARRQEGERQAELARKKALREAAAAWRAAADIRAYAVAVQRAATEGSLSCAAADLTAWSAWAIAHADEIDPITSQTAVRNIPHRRYDSETSR